MLLSNNEEIRAVRITVTGDFEGISLDRTQLLQSLYTTIDCRYVEVVQPTETICLWVDEEGLLNRSDPNFLATLLAAELGSFGQVLRGTIAVRFSPHEPRRHAASLLLGLLSDLGRKTAGRSRNTADRSPDALQDCCPGRHGMPTESATTCVATSTITSATEMRR